MTESVPPQAGYPAVEPKAKVHGAPAFADLVYARFRAQAEAVGAPAVDIWAERFRELRDSFERREGLIQREYWAVHLPLGLALTEKPRSWWKRLLYRPPKMRIHLATLDTGELPPRFHAALGDGDILGVRAAFSLGDLSRHTVLARIFEAQKYLLQVADSSGGHVVSRADASRSVSPADGSTAYGDARDG
jgi:hypothetical protein